MEQWNFWCIQYVRFFPPSLDTSKCVSLDKWNYNSLVTKKVWKHYTLLMATWGKWPPIGLLQQEAQKSNPSFLAHYYFIFADLTYSERKVGGGGGPLFASWICWPSGKDLAEEKYSYLSVGTIRNPENEPSDVGGVQLSECLLAHPGRAWRQLHYRDIAMMPCWSAHKALQWPQISSSTHSPTES